MSRHSVLVYGVIGATEPAEAETMHCSRSSYDNAFPQPHGKQALQEAPSWRVGDTDPECSDEG